MAVALVASISQLAPFSNPHWPRRPRSRPQALIADASKTSAFHSPGIAMFARADLSFAMQITLIYAGEVCRASLFNSTLSQQPRTSWHLKFYFADNAITTLEARDATDADQRVHR
jgi:hypothetical protein